MNLKKKISNFIEYPFLSIQLIIKILVDFFFLKYAKIKSKNFF